ncbi:diacylglycerol kinase 3 isoform X2 [Physcomitrium patens]|uniref:diacylglycerol kinase 3 isoform X2 n=1 Tax=Physcomitrium patens TaxID=3218 RepID=UPI000D15FEEE|nr:diacylglycerol kinase 3-like isoform X2 [Physcomitrium patens]|eukprot:XP_024396907.1 diacylglycerol kinase 3-like isoform X2 [Physcomitrella patens]
MLLGFSLEMISEGKPAAVIAEDPPARADDEGDGASKGLGVKEAGAVVSPSEKTAVPMRVSGTPNGHAEDTSAGRHERNGSMTGAFLAASGYSPSFASLGDTNSLESHHAPKYSDTFEGFEPPRLSQPLEVQETPKVTRPEGLNFTTPAARMIIPEDFKTPQASGAGFTQSSDAGTSSLDTPVESHGDGEDQEPESYISPVANLVEKHPAAGVSPVSPCTPPDLVSALGSVDSFSFSGPPQTPESPEVSHQPYVAPKKIPGHELLGPFMAMSKPSAPSVSPEGSHEVDAVSSPAVDDSRSYDDAVPPLEIHKEPDSVLVQPKPDAAETTQPTTLVTPPSEEPNVSVPPLENLEAAETHPSIAHTDDASTTGNSVDASTVSISGEGISEEVVEKSVGPAPTMVDGKEENSTMPRPQSVSGPESFAFRNVEAEKVESVSATTTQKPGLLMKKASTIFTKQGRNLTDKDLKMTVVIPEYLSKDMAIAVETEGAATPESPPSGEKIVAPTCPVLVFINSKSGGRLGDQLMEHFKDLISPHQLYDLSQHSPIAILRYGVGHLDKMAQSGDECARKTRENLRILVAGGDGTVGWCLSSVGALQEISSFDNVPPVAIIPLGTGNDLSRSFGWGGEFSSTRKSALKNCLVKALDAHVASLDAWKAVVMPAKSVAAHDIEFPHALHPQHHVPLPSSVSGEKHDKDETAPAFEGLFFNYFSVGMDAQVAYDFHHLRDEKPWLARTRAANKLIYSGFGCTQGWFCTACSTDSGASGLSSILKLSGRKRGASSGDWQEIHLPSNIRAIVICNIQSYAGGRIPWGKPSAEIRQKEGLEEQRCDDGLLEVMGLKDGWHSAFMLLKISTAVRLLQAEAVKLEFRGTTRRNAYFQMDGEPWMQPMGDPNDDPSVVMIEKLPSPSLLLKRK